MKFSMLAIAATFLAAGVEGFSAAPTRNFAVRKVSSFSCRIVSGNGERFDSNCAAFVVCIDLLKAEGDVSGG